MSDYWRNSFRRGKKSDKNIGSINGSFMFFEDLKRETGQEKKSRKNTLSLFDNKDIRKHSFDEVPIGFYKLDTNENDKLGRIEEFWEIGTGRDSELYYIEEMLKNNTDKVISSINEELELKPQTMHRNRIFNNISKQDVISRHQFNRVMYPVLASTGIKHIDKRVMNLFLSKVNALKAK